MDIMQSAKLYCNELWQKRSLMAWRNDTLCFNQTKQKVGIDVSDFGLVTSMILSEA